MNKKELISIIVPIYNVEKYLETCIESIIKQTYKKIEIILVNDGSTDNCLQICEKYAATDKRIKVINKENGGLSDARNKGIEKATGKYLIFIDSDDYIDVQMVEKLYTNLIENKADISICNHYYDYQNGNIKFKKFPNKELISNKEKKFYNIYNDYSVSTITAWGKIYKKEIFNNIKYPVGKIHEDEAIVLDILNIAKKISYFDEPLYYYVQRNNSITSNFNIKRLDIISVHESRINKLKKKNNKELLYLEYKTYIKRLIKIIVPGLYSIGEKEKANYYKEKYNYLIKYILSNFKISTKEKLQWIVIKTFPNLYTKKSGIKFQNRIGDDKNENI